MTSEDNQESVRADYLVNPQSSWILAVGYDLENSATFVKAVNGNVYCYGDTSYQDFVALAYADSVGHRYQSFVQEFGPSTNLGVVEIVVSDETDNDVYDQEDYDEENVESEMTTNEGDLDWMYKGHRREALDFAVRLNEGRSQYAQDADEIVSQAEVFFKYLVGESVE